MAKPRIFVSSTYYDLKHIRASLDLFVDSLGFDPVLSEKGDIAYTHDRPLDESCYREVENADVFILIVGGRYGSETSTGSKKPDRNFFDRYESITKKEYDSAVQKDIPIYILIDKGVYSEYQTFARNKDIENIKYAHVDSVNVFLLIEDILAKPRNNPVHTFERFEEIETWLREQWAGLFRELLRRQSQQQQLAGLSQQVVQLKETNETLKKYLEAVMRGVGKQETSKLIESEERRLEELRKLEDVRKNAWVSYAMQRADLPFEVVATAVRDANGFEDFVARIAHQSSSPSVEERLATTLQVSEHARRDLNKAREALGLPLLTPPDKWAAPNSLGERSSRDSAIHLEVPVDTDRAQLSATGKSAAPKSSSKKPAKKASSVTHKTASKKTVAKRVSTKR